MWVVVRSRRVDLIALVVTGTLFVVVNVIMISKAVM